MFLQESETVELKEIVVEDIKKEVIAFANSRGGSLYVGIADDGSIAGVENPDAVMQQIANMVRDSIRPDVTMFVRYDTKILERKTVVCVELNQTAAGRLLKEMVQKGMLVPLGKGKNTRYAPPRGR